MAVFSVLAIVLGVLVPFVYWLLVSGLMHLVTHFFGGSGPFSATLAAVGVAQVPLVISAALTLPLTGLQILLASDGGVATEPSIGLVANLVGLLSGLLGVAASLWFAALVVIGASFARRVGYGESAGSCAISCAGLIALIIVVVVAIVALAAIVAAS